MVAESSAEDGKHNFRQCMRGRCAANRKALKKRAGQELPITNKMTKSDEMTKGDEMIKPRTCSQHKHGKPPEMK